MEKTEQQCRLCDIPQRLAKAHIIPDFMYTGLYKNHRFHQIHMEDNQVKRSFSRETGEFDKNILCPSCDKRLGRIYEGYVKRLFRDETINEDPLMKQHNMIWRPINDVDYTKFKLCMLSVLWRASITSRSFFDQIKLEAHEDIIKGMIRNNDPKETMDYPILIVDCRNYTSQIVGKPKLFNINENWAYVFLIEGGIYVYFIEILNEPEYIRDVTINKQNKLKILMPDKITADRYIKEIFFDIIERNE